MNDPRSERLAFGVSAFGKHPSWGDHIDDIPLPTPELRRVRELFYERGIRRVVDSGVWAELPGGHRLPGFDHVLIWALDGVIVLGRAWHSTDTSGRSAYPFVVVAQIPSGRSDEELERVGGVVDALGEACRGLGDAFEVRDAVRRADEAFVESFRAGSEGGPAREVGHGRKVSWTRELAGEAGDDREGVHRVLFQIEREMAMFLPTGGGGSGSTRRADLSARHIRLPRVREGAWGDVRAWMGFMRERVRADVLVIEAIGQGWCDAIVGECDERTLAPILMTPLAVASASEVAYELDEAFKAHADELIERGTPLDALQGSGGASLGARLGKAALAVRKGAEEIAGSVAPAARISTRGEARGRRVLVPMLIVGAIVAVVFVVLFVLMSEGKKESSGGIGQGAPSARTAGQRPEGEGRAAGDRPGAQEKPSDSGGTSSAGAASRGSEVDRAEVPGRAAVAVDETIPAGEAWSAWVRAWDGWAIDLARRFADGELDPRLAGDAHLLEGMFEGLTARAASHQFRESELRRSPRRSDSAQTLASDPPSEALSPEAVLRAREVATDLGAWRGVLESWAARRRVDSAARSLASIGWTRSSEGLGAIARVPDLASELGGTEGANPIETWMRSVLDAGELSGAMEGRAVRLAGLIDRGAGGEDDSGDDGFWVSQAYALLVRARDPALAEGDAAAVDLIELGERIARARAEDWVSVDRERLALLHGGEVEAGSVDVDARAAIAAFLDAIGDERVQRPDGEDPRVGSDLGGDVGAIARDAGELRERLKGATERARLDGLVERARAVGGEIEAHVRSPWVRSEERAIRDRHARLMGELREVASAVRALDSELVAEFERVISGLVAQERVSDTSDAINAFWKEAAARSAALARQRGPGTPIETWALSLRSTLARIERELPVTGVATIEGGEEQGLSLALAEERERRIGGALESISWSGEAFEGDLEGAIARESSALAATASSVREIGASLESIQRGLERGEGIVGADVSTQWAVLAAIDERGEVRAIIERSVPAVLARVERAARISREPDPAVLLREAGEGWPPARAIALARFVRLAREDGAISIEAIEGAMNARAALADWLGSGRDEVRSAIDEGLAGAWSELVGRSPDARALDAAWALRDRVGGTIEMLSSVGRFNVLAGEFRRSAETGDPKVALRAGEAMLAGTTGVRAELPEAARAWLDRVEELARSAASPGIQEFGPGRVGWAGSVEAGGARVVFEREGAQIAFAQVPGLAGVYLQEEELTVGALIAGLNDKGLARVRSAWGALDRAMAGETGHHGPRGWTVLGGKLAVAARWYSGGSAAVWGAGLVEENPSAMHPVQGISASGARSLGEALGCRLARVSEWQAAMGSRVGVSEVANRLDAAWIEQLRFARAEDPTGQRADVVHPDRGDFFAKGERAFELDRDRAASDERDGVVLFSAGSGLGGFRSMVGNVAEYVLLDAGGIGLIGASALSGRAIVPTIAVRVVDERQDFDDAGVRLCFEASGDLSGGAKWRELGSAVPFVSAGR